MLSALSNSWGGEVVNKYMSGTDVQSRIHFNVEFRAQQVRHSPQGRDEVSGDFSLAWLMQDAEEEGQEADEKEKNHGGGRR